MQAIRETFVLLLPTRVSLITMADYPPNYYASTLINNVCWPSLSGRHETDVCIVGGGLAGVATALALAERGHSVTLLEEHRIGWGASGRNGGFVSAG